MIWMQGGGTLARNTGPRQWAKPPLIPCWPHKRLMGEVTGVSRHPLAGQGFDFRRARLSIFVLAAVALYPACLFAHARTEQRMFIGKRNSDAVAVFHLATPRHVAWVSGGGAQGWNVQVNGRALAPGARPIAGNATQAVREQTLAGYGGRGALD